MPILSVLLGVPPDEHLATAAADEPLTITADRLHRRRELTAAHRDWGDWTQPGRAAGAR